MNTFAQSVTEKKDSHPVWIRDFNESFFLSFLRKTGFFLWINLLYPNKLFPKICIWRIYVVWTMTVQHCTADRTNINWTNKKMLINSARNINYHKFSYLTNFDDTFYMMFSKQNWLLKIIFQSTFKQSDFSSHLGKKSTGWCWSISAQYTNWVFCSDVAKLSKKIARPRSCPKNWAHSYNQPCLQMFPENDFCLER